MSLTPQYDPEKQIIVALETCSRRKLFASPKLRFDKGFSKSGVFIVKTAVICCVAHSSNRGNQCKSARVGAKGIR